MAFHRLRVFISTAIAAVATIGIVSTGIAPMATADSLPVRPQSSSAITWETCPPQVTVATAECGRIGVPMYHADPAGRQISLGFMRVPAADSSARKGALFGNPGGPGGDAYSYFGDDQSGIFRWPNELKNEWDLVAVQPRGLQGSTPIDCNHEPDGYGPLRTQLESAGYLKAACEIGTPGYTEALNTSEMAEDWEDVRAALGEEQISLLGVSYGTPLVATYATKYPERTSRTIIDSGFDPQILGAGLLDSQTNGYINALHDFLSWAAENNETYGLGDTPLEVYRSWSQVIVEESGTNPTVVPPPAQIGDLPPGLQWAGRPAADVLTAVGGPLARVENLFYMVAVPGTVQSTSLMLSMTRIMVPQPDSWGTLAARIAGTAPSPSAEDLDEFLNQEGVLIPEQMKFLVLCNENAVPADYRRIPGAIWDGYVVGDGFSTPGNLAASGLLCSGITPTAPEIVVNGDHLETKPLQLQGTGDPQTTYGTYQLLASAMGSHVITVQGPGHGQFGFGNPVVDDAVMEYLRTGSTSVVSAPSRSIL